MSRRASNRHGYALMLVMIFVVLFSVVLGVAWRRVASALRIEHVSEVRKRCDQGSVQVLAKAMQVLEACLCRKGNDPAKIKVGNVYPLQFRYPALPGDITQQWYKIDFARESGDIDGTQWSVSVTVAKPDEDYNNATDRELLPTNPP